jgi:putative spermidine/putrescine transport system ATP-binding protein
VYEPTVLLMDEPLGALDRRLREVVKLELVQLHRSIATTIIYVTHDQDEALTMSDRIAVMRGGKIVQVGTPRQIYEQPHDEFVAEFVGESSLLSGRLHDVDQGRCRVKLDAGPVVDAQSPREIPRGQPVQLLLRPEKLRLLAPHVGRLDGTVSDAIFLGDSMRYDVALNDGSRLLVRRHNRTGLRDFAPGDSVGIDWDASDAMVLA